MKAERVDDVLRFSFHPRGCCQFIAATDTSTTPQLVLSGGLESSSRPAGATSLLLTPRDEL